MDHFRVLEMNSNQDQKMDKDRDQAKEVSNRALEVDKNQDWGNQDLVKGDSNRDQEVVKKEDSSQDQDRVNKEVNKDKVADNSLLNQLEVVWKEDRAR